MKKEDIALQIKAKNAEALALLDKEGATDDEMNKATGLMSEVKTLEDQYRVLEAREEMKKQAQETDKWVKESGGGFLQPEGEADVKVKDVKIFASPRRVKGVKSFKDSDGLTKEEKAYSFGMLAIAATCGNNLLDVPFAEKAIRFCKDHGISLKAQSEGVNTAGGVLVPDQFTNDIIDLRESYGVFRQYSRVRPMSSDVMLIPRRSSGLTVYFPSEGGSITESEKGWNNVTLTAKKFACLAKMSSELNEDAIIDIGSDLASEIAYAFANKEDECGFNGDGTSTYCGITGVRAALRAVDATIANIKGLYVGTGNAYSELTLTDFEGVVSLLPQYADTPNARWFMHRTFYYQVAVREALEAGGVTKEEIVNGQRTPMYLGYPVVFSQVLPKVEGNSQICALLGDLALATSLGDRRGVTIATSEHAYFSTDQIGIRGTQRVDIVCHDVGNTTDAGPLVGLITAAS